MTPPSLLGMDRKIAYAQRKYHSGLIWVGVTSGLAGMKFSGSPRKLGLKNLIQHKVNPKIMNPSISLEE